MLHLISADLPSDALAVAGHLQRCLASDWQQPLLLDLSGDCLLTSLEATHPLATGTCFQQADYQRLAWGRLAPGLVEWLELLQLLAARPELLPPLPGVAQLLQCFALADWLAPEPAAEVGVGAVVLLPPLHQALQLLEVARTGPALVEQWLDPLLAWWQETRKSLSRLDLVLRLKLPDGEALRLSSLWRQKLNDLASQLADPGCHQLLCVLDAGAGQPRLLSDRLCRIYLQDFQPARLWIRGPGAGPAEKALAAITGPMALGHGPQLHSGGRQLEAWLDQDWTAEPPLKWHIEAGTTVCKLLLPGLRKELLQVQQIDGQVLIQVAGSRRLLPLPDDLAGQSCTGAKLVGRHLQLQFD